MVAKLGYSKLLDYSYLHDTSQILKYTETGACWHNRQNTSSPNGSVRSHSKQENPAIIESESNTVGWAARIKDMESSFVLSSFGQSVLALVAANSHSCYRSKLPCHRWPCSNRNFLPRAPFFPPSQKRLGQSQQANHFSSTSEACIDEPLYKWKGCVLREYKMD